MGVRDVMVYIGGLSYDCRERDLERFFKSYGRLRDIALKRGFAFVEFEDYRDAEDAIYDLNGKEFMGERVSVERARGTPHGSDIWRAGGGRGSSSRRRDGSRERDRGRREDRRYGPPTRTDHRIYVENLSSRVSWQDLKDYFRREGCEVTFADAHKERRNEAVVEFASYEDVKRAMDRVDGLDINGRKVKLVEDRRRTRSRSRSRSRSRRRSRSRTRSRSRRKSRSRSRSPVKRARSRTRSRSVSKARNGDKDSKSKSRSRSKSIGRRSRDRDRSRSRERDATSKSRSKSRDRSRSVSKDRGTAGASMSKSRSRSPADNRSDD